MESHPKSATAGNNLYNASYCIIQKRKIAQRYARQGKTLEAHVPPPQNHIGESVSACLWPLLSANFEFEIQNSLVSRRSKVLSWKVLDRYNLPPLMPDELPDEDKNFGGSLVLDFRKWWRHCIHYIFIYGGITCAYIPCIHITLHIWWHTVAPLHPSPLHLNKGSISRACGQPFPFFVFSSPVVSLILIEKEIRGFCCPS